MGTIQSVEGRESTYFKSNVSMPLSVIGSKKGQNSNSGSIATLNLDKSPIQVQE